MRPVRLEIEGFTSFSKRTAIDFDGFDLFGITGPTGAGKTSILDGILYALYGRTPRIGERDVLRLVSQGSPEVKAQLEFDARGKRYRVTRCRKIRKSSNTEVKLEERQGEEWHSMAGSVREIEPRIGEILGLDFDGFTRSVILPQGKFDDFLRGDAKDRTEMLKTLLELRVYEGMKKRANERASVLKTKVEAKESVIAQAYGDATPERRQLLDAELGELSSQRDQVAREMERLQQLQPALIELQNEEKSLGADQAELDKARAELAKMAELGAEEDRRIESIRARVVELQSRLEKTSYDEAAYGTLVEAVPLFRQKDSIDREVGELRTELKQREAELKAAEGAVAAATAGVTATETVTEEIALRCSTLDETREVVLLLRQAADGLQNYWLADAESQKKTAEVCLRSAEQTLEELRTRHAALEIRRHLHTGDACPVCEQEVKKVPAAGKLDAIETAEAALATARRELREFEARYQQFAVAKENAQRLVKGAPDPERLDALTLRTGELLEARKQADDAEGSRQDAARRVDESRQRTLAADKKRQELYEQLRDFAQLALYPLEDLAHMLQEQRDAKRSHEELQRFEAKAKEDLEAAHRQSQERLIRKGVLEGILAKLENAVTDRKGRIRALSGALRKAGFEQPALLATMLRDAGLLVQKAEQAIAVKRAAVLEVERKMEEAERLRAEIESQAAEAQKYHRLGFMLADNRFIAFVQREALNRLAAEASERLHEMSEGRYTLTLSDDRNEFFVIDDWNGGESRSVKTLSGGESFLASLALALALSDGLSGFAGEQARSRLDSLFIDEGISSLDPESMQAVITALLSLTEGNRMVGVISHVTELADNLPARIRVEKSPAGSRAFVENHSHSIVAGGL